MNRTLASKQFRVGAAIFFSLPLALGVICAPIFFGLEYFDASGNSSGLQDLLVLPILLSLALAEFEPFALYLIWTGALILIAWRTTGATKKDKVLLSLCLLCLVVWTGFFLWWNLTSQSAPFKLF
jgi:hypothetical protein